MYMPTLGRFMSRDPLHQDYDVLSDNNWFGQNLDAMAQQGYAYVSNNPVNVVDPSGSQEAAPNMPSLEADRRAKSANKKGRGHIIIDPSCAGFCFWMKPEEGAKRWECKTGVSFDADGVWGPCFMGRVYKVVDGCTLTLSCRKRPDGTMYAVCSVECEGAYSGLGQTLTGGCVDDPWTNDPPKVQGPATGPTLRCWGDCETPEILAPPGM